MKTMNSFIPFDSIFRKAFSLIIISSESEFGLRSVRNVELVVNFCQSSNVKFFKQVQNNYFSIQASNSLHRRMVQKEKEYLKQILQSNIMNISQNLDNFLVKTELPPEMLLHWLILSI